MVVRFLAQAARDPGCGLAIKQTLHIRHLARQFPIVEALCGKHAEDGKIGYALVEVKARFDGSRQHPPGSRAELERAGAHVVYGFSRP